MELSEGPFHPSATLEHKEKAEFPEDKAEWIRILYSHPSHSVILASPPPRAQGILALLRLWTHLRNKAQVTPALSRM